jgi:predicted RNA-binding Zn-ribbon protein involved in translation (DUF1610 family)
MKEKKYVCPQCGSDVLYWTEMVHDRIQKINPISGVIGKRVSDSEGLPYGTEGVKCTSCDWSISLTSLTDYDGIFDEDWCVKNGKV